jgi:hypothetical protein
MLTFLFYGLAFCAFAFCAPLLAMPMTLVCLAVLGSREKNKDDQKSAAVNICALVTNFVSHAIAGLLIWKAALWADVTPSVWMLVVPIGLAFLVNDLPRIRACSGKPDTMRIEVLSTIGAAAGFLLPAFIFAS